MAGTLYDAYLVQATVTAADNSHTVVRAIEAYDATVYATGTNAGGTIQVKNGATNLTNTMACDTANAVARAVTFDGTQRLFAAGSVMNFDSVNNAAGIVTVHCFVTGSGAAG